jgi:hypothetical protein
MDDIRARLVKGMGLAGRDVEVVLHPSGTDAEYIPLLYAVQRAEALGCSRVVNVIAAAGEVGSHTATAAGGKHISNFRPMGGTCVLNEPVEGFNTNNIKVVEVMPRGDTGGIVPNYDAAMESAVNAAEEEMSGAFYILHAALSKTGLFMPSHGAMEAMMERLKGRYVLVFDACQMRVSAEEMNWYMDRGAIILVTGSKFFGAPGFCGAVVCPKAVTQEFATNAHVPEGLSSYLTKSDVSTAMTKLRDSLTENGPNIGLALRWTCALTEMEEYNTHKAEYEPKMSTWVRGVRDQVAQYAPYLELQPDEGQEDDAHMGGWNTTIGIRMNGQGTTLNLNDLKRVHVLLRKDLSGELPPSATQEEREAVKKKCFIGQPVWLGTHGVLRIALGAPVTRCWGSEEGMAQCLKDDNYILHKWALVTKYFKELSC